MNTVNSLITKRQHNIWLLVEVTHNTEHTHAHSSSKNTHSREHQHEEYRKNIATHDRPPHARTHVFSIARSMNLGRTGKRADEIRQRTKMFARRLDYVAQNAWASRICAAAVVLHLRRIGFRIRVRAYMNMNYCSICIWRLDMTSTDLWCSTFEYSV